MTLEQTKKFTEQDENTLQYYNQNDVGVKSFSIVP